METQNTTEISARQVIGDSSILYVEDDVITQENLSQYLKPLCKLLYTAADGVMGLELFKAHAPDIVITDIQMPMLNGLDMAREIREISLSTQIIIITAHKKPEYLLEAVNLQLIQYLIKPISIVKINDALELTSKYLNKKVKSTKYYIDEEVFYDSYTKELIAVDQVIQLSKNERALLEILIDIHPGPVSYERINIKIYEYGASKNALKLLINSLRGKIKKQSITNISGFGYKLNLAGDDQ